jgi:hypothetical protein
MHLNKNLNRMQGNTFLSKCFSSPSNPHFEKSVHVKRPIRF